MTKHNPYPRRRDAKGLYYVHRAMAALKLGRELKPWEEVHHLNGDKEDGHPDNLVIFSSHRAHMLFENYLIRERRGVVHLFSLEEVLGVEGEWMVR